MQVLNEIKRRRKNQKTDLSAFLDLLLKIREIKYPDKRAAEQPAEADEKGPFKMPIKPSESIISFVPLTIAAPKPIRGTEAPAPAISNKGL